MTDVTQLCQVTQQREKVITVTPVIIMLLRWWKRIWVAGVNGADSSVWELGDGWVTGLMGFRLKSAHLSDTWDVSYLFNRYVTDESMKVCTWGHLDKKEPLSTVHCMRVLGSTGTRRDTSKLTIAQTDLPCD
ncbi:hypothetical protein Btru_052956 [Bulinus truncatus]|nr:hypothetical protein Btru_052956 [Bulinus truncatus]